LPIPVRPASSVNLTITVAAAPSRSSAVASGASSGMTSTEEILLTCTGMEWIAFRTRRLEDCIGAPFGSLSGRMTASGHELPTRRRPQRVGFARGSGRASPRARLQQGARSRHLVLRAPEHGTAVLPSRSCGLIFHPSSALQYPGQDGWGADVRFQPTSPSARQRVYRVFQQPIARRVPQCALYLVSG